VQLALSDPQTNVFPQKANFLQISSYPVWAIAAFI
jgi:hypothetical protein